MSLVGYQAKNHPQQKAREDVDDRAIRDEDFAPLHERFRFTVDAAAAPHNAKLPRYWTRDDDALQQNWWAERVWCNPPYSEIPRWVNKAWATWETAREHDALDHRTAIVMLLPANRTEQKWWQQQVEPALRARAGDFHVEFLPGRMRFDRPGAVIGPKGDRPPFGCCLLVWGAA
jgi:phage N-6-adenine-methyltransferase